MTTKKTEQDIIAEAISSSQKVFHIDPKSIKTERQMVLSRHPAETIQHYSNGNMPLDAKKVKAMVKSLKSGELLPPVKIGKNGILKDGHHRLHAHLTLGARTIAATIEE